MKRTWGSVAAALLLTVSLAACGGAAPQTEASYISMESAQSAALSGANVAAADADISATTLRDVHGVTCYQVDFSANGQSYSYSVNAVTGTVVEASRSDAPLADSPALPEAAPAEGTAPAQSGSAAGITVEQAKQLALDHAGVKDATFIKARQEYEDGRQVYDVEFFTGSGSAFTEYDYEISAATGEILSYDMDIEGYDPAVGSTVSGGVAVSEAAARQTALSRVSGAADSDIRQIRLDYDDGRWEYEGTILYNKMEYEFTIDANTGSVLEWEAESIYD